MFYAPKRKPTISLTAFGGRVHTGNDSRHTYLNVTFKCAFSDRTADVYGNDNIIIETRDLLSVVHQAHMHYMTIVRVLASQEKQQRNDDSGARPKTWMVTYSPQVNTDLDERESGGLMPCFRISPEGDPERWIAQINPTLPLEDQQELAFQMAQGLFIVLAT